MAELSSYSAVTTLAGTELLPVITTPGIAGGNKVITADNFALFTGGGGGTTWPGTVITTATGDGTTNDLTQLRTDLASAAGGRLYLPPGSYKCEVSTLLQAFFTPGAETVIEGAGKSVTELVLYATDAGYHTGFAVNVADVTLKNITVRRASQYESVLFLRAGGSHRFKTESCLFDGAWSTFGAGYSHGHQYPNSGTVDGTASEWCTWQDTEYPFLTNNASTATISNVRYTHCNMLNNAADGAGFNSPNGTVRDVGVSECRIVGAGMGIDFAHIEGGFATNNYIETEHDAIHIEDYSTDLTISGNTFYECATVAGGSAPVMILDSSDITIGDNKIVNTTGTVAGFVVQVLGSASGTTVGGRAKLGATHDISIVDNKIKAGPNTAIWLMHCDNFKINDNTLRGALLISNTYVESGTNTGSGIAVVGNENLGGTVNGNGISGFRYATYAPTNGQSTWQPGTTITGNTISQCRYGIDGRTNRGVGIAGNTITRTIHPMIVGAHGNTGAGAGCAPYTIVGNTMYDNKRQASIDGRVVIVAAGAATVGSGVTLTIDPLLLDLISNRAITFSGGGILTTTTIGTSGAASLVGNLTVANIASGEYAIVTGLVDRPHEAPFTVNNHVIAANTDSVLATYKAVAAADVSGLGNLATATTLAEYICVALSDETTAITTGTAKATIRMPFAMTVTAVRASVNTVSSSGLPTVDINDGGTTILSTKLTIDASEFTSATAATPAVISDSALADDAEITFDIDVAGTGAKGLKVWIIGTRVV